MLKQGREWLDAYFQGKHPSVEDLPLKPAGTAFQQVVWKELGNVSYGEVTTYGKLAEDVANAMGKERMSAQAVGMALSKNPIAIMIPCHRVVGADGSLTGYAGGLEKKIALLDLEGGRYKAL